METVYNGSGACEVCGALLTPVETTYGAVLCSRCKKAERDRRIKNRMV